MKKGDYNISKEKEQEWQDFMSEVRNQNMFWLAKPKKTENENI